MMSDIVERLRAPKRNASDAFRNLDGEAADTIEQQAKRIEELEAQTQWMPIEEAKKDGGELILGDEHSSWSGFWSDIPNHWGHVGWYDECYRGNVLTAKPLEPTHFMHLPQPPEQGEG